MRPALKKNDFLFGYKTFALHPNLSGAAKSVGAAILDHFNKKSGQCDPGIDRLSRLTRYARRTVIKAIDELTSDEVQLIFRVRHGGKLHRNQYLPNFKAFREFVANWDVEMKSGSPAKTHSNSAQNPQSLSTDEKCTNVHPKQSTKVHLASEQECTQTHITNPSKTSLEGAKAEVTEPSTSKDAHVKTPPPSAERNEPIKTRAAKVSPMPARFGNRSSATSTCRNTSKANAAREQAHRRIHDHFLRIGGNFYIRWCEIAGLGEPGYEEAVDAEINERGAGVRIIKERLFKLEPG